VAQPTARRIILSHEKLCPVHRGIIAMSGFPARVAPLSSTLPNHDEGPKGVRHCR